MNDPIDICDPEYAMPGELERGLPPLTGPQLTQLQLDSLQQRAANLETHVAELERKLEMLGRNLVRAVNGTGLTDRTL